MINGSSREAHLNRELPVLVSTARMTSEGEEIGVEHMKHYQLDEFDIVAIAERWPDRADEIEAGNAPDHPPVLPIASASLALVCAGCIVSIFA